MNYEVHTTLQPGHGEQLGRQVREGEYDSLFVLGGDGTMSEVARGFIGSQVPVANFPCGSGNDLAGALGMSRDLAKSLDSLQPAEIAPIVLIRDCGTIYTETIGTGFVAHVVDNVLKINRTIRGPAAYFASVFKTLARFQPAHYKITVDNEHWQGEASLVIVNNNFRVGGGMRITPDAKLDDGILDVAIFKSSSKMTLLSLLPKVYTGGHVGSEHIIMLRGRSVKVESDRELLKTADGDLVGKLPIDAEVIPQAMNFFRIDRPE